MKGTETGAKAATASAPTPNEGVTAPAPTQGSPAPTPAVLPALPPRKWGEGAPEAAWVKLRDLVGHSFRIVRIARAAVTPATGPNAGKARPSFIFELATGHLFSVNETDAMGRELLGLGLPPVPGDYWAEELPSTDPTRKGAILLRAL